MTTSPHKSLPSRPGGSSSSSVGPRVSFSPLPARQQQQQQQPLPSSSRPPKPPLPAPRPLRHHHHQEQTTMTAVLHELRHASATTTTTAANRWAPTYGSRHDYCRRPEAAVELVMDELRVLVEPMAARVIAASPDMTEADVAADRTFEWLKQQWRMLMPMVHDGYATSQHLDTFCDTCNIILAWVQALKAQALALEALTLDSAPAGGCVSLRASEK